MRWVFSRARTPDLSVDTNDRLAGLNVEDLKVESKVYTGLTLSDILTNVLSGNVVWALGDLRGEDTGAVAGKESGLGRGEVVVLSGQVRDVQVRYITSYKRIKLVWDTNKEGVVFHIALGGVRLHIQLSREIPLFSAASRASCSRRLMLRASRPRALILAEQWERLFLVCWR